MSPLTGRTWRNANARARFTCKVAWSQGTFEWQQKYQPERTSLTLTSLQGNSNSILSLPFLGGQTLLGSRGLREDAWVSGPMESRFPQELVPRPLVRQKSHDVKIALKNPVRHPGSTTSKHITSQETPASSLFLQLGRGLCGLRGAAEEVTGSQGTLDQKHLSLRVIRCWCDMRPGKGCHACSHGTLSTGTTCSRRGGQETHLLHYVTVYISLSLPCTHPHTERVPLTSCPLNGRSRKCPS